MSILHLIRRRGAHDDGGFNTDVFFGCQKVCSLNISAPFPRPKRKNLLVWILLLVVLVLLVLVLVGGGAGVGGW